MSRGPGEDPQSAQLVCAGNIQANGTVRKQRGCVVARTGVGVYTVTVNPVAVSGETVTQTGNLSGGIPINRLISEVQSAGGAAERFVQLENTSDTVKTIRIFEDAAGQAAVDSDFEFVFKRLLASDS